MQWLEVPMSAEPTYRLVRTSVDRLVDTPKALRLVYHLEQSQYACRS